MAIVVNYREEDLNEGKELSLLSYPFLFCANTRVSFFPFCHLISNLGVEVSTRSLGYTIE